jgi:YfiH family protein
MDPIASTHASHALPYAWISPDMGAGVRSVMSARAGGVSVRPYDSCNLGDHVLDELAAVAHNRQVMCSVMQAQPVWLTQVHGNLCVRLSHADAAVQAALTGAPGQNQIVADGAMTTEPGLACTVMVADCLPVLLAAPDGRGVAALHAGWRGLAGAGDMRGQGIVHTGVAALCEAASCKPDALLAWLGPCIGPTQFEVGGDVLLGFGVDPAASTAHPHFMRSAVSPDGSPRWLANLPGLAAGILRQLGVRQISGGHWCTASDPSRFFSFRRDRVTGRQAASICLV